jgi:hypothetical protein
MRLYLIVWNDNLYFTTLSVDEQDAMKRKVMEKFCQEESTADQIKRLLTATNRMERQKVAHRDAQLVLEEKINQNHVLLNQLKAKHEDREMGEATMQTLERIAKSPKVLEDFFLFLTLFEGKVDPQDGFEKMLIELEYDYFHKIRLIKQC